MDNDARATIAMVLGVTVFFGLIVTCLFVLIFRT